MQQSLAELGVNDSLLTAKEKQELDDNGFTILQGVLSAAQVEEARAAFEHICEKERKSAGLEVHQEAGTRRISDLVNKAEIFDIFYTHPRVLSAIHYVFKKDFRLSSLNGRDALPGEGNQVLHADGPPAKAIGDYIVCNSIWLLDDFERDNGCTRLVPGSHKSLKSPHEEMEDPAQTHPDEVYLIAPAGSVGVFNSHTWHGGTINVTHDKTRRACHSYFSLRTEPQQLNQQEYIRLKTWKRISPAARYILDVDTNLDNP